MWQLYRQLQNWLGRYILQQDKGILEAEQLILQFGILK